MHELTFYKKRSTIQYAEALCPVLEDNHTKYQIFDNSPPIDVTFTNNSLLKQFQLCINQVDIEKIDAY
ncbi:MAG: hypothetical protein ACI8SA_001540 [Dokdonia sp.]|jgi:hypothetical protein